MGARSVGLLLVVSILTGPFGPVQRRVSLRRGLHPCVSILTGPFGPVQPGSPTRSLSVFTPFQSSPALSGRCNARGLPRGRGTRVGFNPHRPFRAGATPGRDTGAPEFGCFNPHRPFRAGATGPPGCHPPSGRSFNPHRPFRAGATWFSTASCARTTGFQSSPALSGRCNLPLPLLPTIRMRFQSSPALSGRCNQGKTRPVIEDAKFQSSQALSGRCNVLAQAAPRAR